MAIDTTVWTRDLQAQILDLPVKFKFNNRVYDVTFEATSFALALLEGGLPEDFKGRITIVKAEIKGRLPVNRDLAQIQVNGGSWLKVEIKDTPDIIDIQSVGITLMIGSPEI